jgi:enolase
VVVWDGSGNQYYKNGQYLGRTTNLYSPNPGGDVTIGGVRSQVPSQNLQEFANSTVNIVRVYNRALSATEILQNFNSIKTQYGL